MKRTQRTSHLVLWLILAPLMAGLIALAIFARPAPPVNDNLPPALSEEAS